ncbi:MAG: hypothetical protein HQL71_00305 [Magnetococcales bacterium]|nr:hypothetical protein [Magnetococcales bacterium]
MLFSEKYRLIKIFLSIFILLLFCIYAQIEGKRIKDNEMEKHSSCLKKSHICKNLTLSYYGMVSEVTNNSFTFHPRVSKGFGGGDKFESIQPLHIEDTPQNSLKTGDKINLLVRYDEQSLPNFVKFYQIKGERRFIKYFISCLGLGLWLLLFLQRYNISWQTKSLFTPRVES